MGKKNEAKTVVKEIAKYSHDQDYKRLAEVMRNSNDAIIIQDEDGWITAWNRGAEQMYGYTEEEALGMNIERLMPPEKVAEQKEFFRRLIADEAVTSFETIRHAKDGSILNIWLTVTKIMEEPTDIIVSTGHAIDKPVSIALIERNITERKRAEEMLKQRTDAMEMAKDGLAILDVDQNYTYMNKAHAEIYGYADAGELIKKSWRVLYCDDELQRFEQEIMPELIQKGYYHGTASGKKKDGSTFPQEVSLTVLENGGMICVVRDITKIKQAEEERKKLEERLIHATKMEAIGTLASGIAHNFNNILMGIQGHTSLALFHLNSPHPNLEYEHLKSIEGQVKSGAELTRQLLDFASGRKYDVRAINVNELLDRTSSMFGRTKKEISVHKNYSNNLWTVEVDAGQIDQVFLNLLVNAGQAMPAGGDIYLETDNICLDDASATFFSGKTGPFVKISVTDTGMGMDEKTIERIFDPFFTTKNMGRGTGLGLATVYGIVKSHDGVINVCSRPGHGTTFNIFLPASEKAVTARNVSAGTILKGTEKILLVDDEVAVLDVSRKLLELLGYEVYTAGNGQDAISVYLEKGREVDLILLDMIMPVMSGGETFDCLRKINPEVKILLLSGYSINGEAENIVERGCNGFLQKPFQIEELSRKVREVLTG